MAVAVVIVVVLYQGVEVFVVVAERPSQSSATET